jgi:predicted short-subunit dehydrogenase-like oxidoreductase (DUF2520 family)
MTHYAILGGGRLARHMRHYLTLLNQTVSCWERDPVGPGNTHAIASPTERLRATIRPASHVLLLVSDGSIAELLKRYPFLHEKTLLHCSGALSIPGVAGAHPLMTFGHELYTLELYRKIPFMVDRGHDFDALLPGLPNPHFHLSVEEKPRYHALCVMAGNFCQILWQATAERFAGMGLPVATLAPYLQQVVHNFVHHPHTALTGPLSRGDQQTIERNLNALAGDALEPVYRAFLELYATGDKVQELRQAAQ